MPRLSLFSLTILSISFWAGSRSLAQNVDLSLHARPVVTEKIDESKLHSLPGNVRPEANAVNDRGRVDDGLAMEHLLLQLRRPSEQESALDRFLDQLHDPASQNFQHWLTGDEFGQRFGLAEEDLGRVRNWLESHGFVVNLIYPNRVLIDFSGTAGQIREAFHTEIHQLEVNRAQHVANVRDPEIPAALVPVIIGIVSLHDFMPHPMYKPRSNYTFQDLFGDPLYAVVPADLATIYNLNPLFKAGYSGKGQTIALIEDTNLYSTSDWATFRHAFGLSSYSSGALATIHPAPKSGSSNCSNPGVIPSNDAEATLDAEWASAAAPSATIELASCADTATTFGGLIALQNLVNGSGTPPGVVSISYGACEAENGASANAAYSLAYQQAVAEGISVFVAAGDSGAAVCDPQAMTAVHGIGINAFASTGYNVAVGGTDFGDTYSGTNSIYWTERNTSNYGSATSYVPEIPWNDSCASGLLSQYWTGSSTTYGPSSFCNNDLGQLLFLNVAAGSGGPSGCAMGTPVRNGVTGGTCRGTPKPSWQAGVVGIPGDGVRDLPDISLFAADGVWSHYYVFCWSDTVNGGTPCLGAPANWSGAGGTSFASPILAGIQALVNQKTGKRQGNPNYVYYKLAAKEYGVTGSTSCDANNGSDVSSGCIFYDITLGDMNVPCTGGLNCYGASGEVGVVSTSDLSPRLAYIANTGWDFATGIGSLNAYNLVANWSVVTSPH
jgi:subtilase family serine protease